MSRVDPLKLKVCHIGALCHVACSRDAIDLETVDLDAGDSGDSGPFFRFSDDKWVYNLSTKGTDSGTFSITLEMPDGRTYVTGFVLK